MKWIPELAIALVNLIANALSKKPQTPKRGDALGEELLPKKNRRKEDQ